MSFLSKIKLKKHYGTSGTHRKAIKSSKPGVVLAPIIGPAYTHFPIVANNCVITGRLSFANI